MSDPVWISLLPIVILNTVFGISIIAFLIARKKRNMQPPEYLTSRHTSRILSMSLKHWWLWQIEPLVKLLIRFGFTPNIITLTGFLIGGVAAFIFARGWFGYAGWVLFLGATFDMFDGLVARSTGQISRSGALFDSVMDRFTEGIVFLGLAYYFRETWWMVAVIIVAIIGSMIVSYARARGEGVGVQVKIGMMQRPERIVYLGVASIFEPLTTPLSLYFSDHPFPFLPIAALCFIALMSNITGIYRMLYVMRILDREDFPSVLKNK